MLSRSLHWLSARSEPTAHLAAASCSWSAAIWSWSSHICSSVKVLFFLPSLSSFSRSLIAFFASFALKDTFFFTSILLPDASKTSSGPCWAACISSSVSLDSPSIRKYPPFMIHFSVAFQVHLRIPEQCERSIRQGEATFVKVNTLVVLVLKFLRRLAGNLHLINVIASVHHPPPSWLVHAEDREPVVLNTYLLFLNLVLNEHALQFVALREALQLLIGNC